MSLILTEFDIPNDGTVENALPTVKTSLYF